ncbi:DUF2510 domain-containing protein [Agromyces sp. NPDC058110]|uniref:DUF2510 domain-containing protein n=1 Tax=Agromyces sp. NPDC058110 TaxID=3346345 RepID=UPI0036DBD0C6
MSDPTNTGTPAGWYDDGSGCQRYWDGQQWTDRFAPTEPAGAAEPAAASGTATPPGATPPGGKGKPHVLGIIALVVAAVGFVFACIPFAFVVGWVLLPIAFVLAIVGLFMRGAKWAAITALIVSILGTIAGIVVFFLVASVTINEAVDELPSAIAEASEEADASEEPADEEPPPASETLAFGETWAWENGLELTVSAPEAYTPTEFAAGADLAANLVFTLTITNDTTENFEPVVFSRLSSAGQEASQIFDVPPDGTQIGVPPTTVVLPGESVTWQEAWSVADPNSLTMQISPNFDYEDAIFTNLQ